MESNSFYRAIAAAGPHGVLPSMPSTRLPKPGETERMLLLRADPHRIGRATGGVLFFGCICASVSLCEDLTGYVRGSGTLQCTIGGTGDPI